MPFRTTEKTTVTSLQNGEKINVPKGTLVTPIMGGGGNVSYAVIDSNVLNQQDSHDRKYRYVWVPTNIVAEAEK